LSGITWYGIRTTVSVDTVDPSSIPFVADSAGFERYMMGIALPNGEGPPDRLIQTFAASGSCPGERDPRSAREHPLVLVVDDDHGTLQTMTAFLRLAGYRAECVDRGGAALERVQRQHYAAIILDLRLPDIDGIRVLRHLRQRGLETPIIVQTAFGDIPTAVEAMKLGAADFFSKGVSSKTELAAALANALESRRGTDHPHEECGVPSDVLDGVLGYIQTVKDCLRDDQCLCLAEWTYRNLLGSLCRALSRQRLTTCQFVMCARALRHVVTTGEPGRIDIDLLDAAARQVADAARAGDEELDADVKQTLRKLEAGANGGVLMSEDDLASALGMGTAALGRLVKRKTGVGFREWRRACRVRRAIRELVTKPEQVAQIAYHVGLKHGSELDRDFHEMFGLTPREFRRLSQGLPCGS
jgi:DNA-binding response OmpR family regulator/AraC-like DNA-binding protein